MMVFACECRERIRVKSHGRFAILDSRQQNARAHHVPSRLKRSGNAQHICHAWEAASLFPVAGIFEFRRKKFSRSYLYLMPASREKFTP
jgi:hypothetical protein